MSDQRLRQATSAIARRIVEVLDRKGWTQQDLADALDVPKSNVSRILSGTANLTVKTITKIEQILGERIIRVEKD